jgi:hypothetical protein
VILRLFQYKVWEDISIQGMSLKASCFFINFKLVKKKYLRIIWKI